VLPAAVPELMSGLSYEQPFSSLSPDKLFYALRDLATWAAAKDALDSDDGDEIDDLFQDVSECSEHRLWKIEDTK